jgi:hypothetical protein
VLSTTEYQSNNTNTGFGPRPDRAPRQVQIQREIADDTEEPGPLMHPSDASLFEELEAFGGRVDNMNFNNSSLRPSGCTRSCMHSTVRVQRAGLGFLPARRTHRSCSARSTLLVCVHCHNPNATAGIASNTVPSSAMDAFCFLCVLVWLCSHNSLHELDPSSSNWSSLTGVNR